MIASKMSARDGIVLAGLVLPDASVALAVNLVSGHTADTKDAVGAASCIEKAI
jgi:hypothetical protein